MASISAHLKRTYHRFASTEAPENRHQKPSRMGKLSSELVTHIGTFLPFEDMTSFVSTHRSQSIIDGIVSVKKAVGEMLSEQIQTRKSSIDSRQLVRLGQHFKPEATPIKITLYDGSDLKYLRPVFQNIKELNVEGVFNEQDIDELTRLKQLETLIFNREGGFDYLGDNSLSFLRELPELKAFHLDLFGGLFGDVFENLGKLSLQYISLKGSILEDVNLMPLAELESLQTLDLSGCEGLDDGDCDQLVAAKKGARLEIIREEE